MNFSPAPPDLFDFADLATLAARLTEHIAQERRRTWEVSTSDVLVHPDGTLSARGHAPVALERAGFDGLLQHYSVCFPRSPTILSRLSPALFGAVWSELFAPMTPGMPLDVKVHERTGDDGARARAVWAVSPVSYPGHYHVGRLVADIAARWAGTPPMTMLRYFAGESRVEATLHLDGYEVVVRAVDQYDGGGVTVSVVRGGVDLGDPCPTLKSRRRGGSDASVVGSSVADGVLTKIAASRAFVREVRS